MSGTNAARHRRRSIRLRGYDYTQPGAYFVTICVQNRECLFGTIAGGEMHLNDAGRMIQEVWKHMPERFPIVQMDTYIVMPNHFHAIIAMVEAPLVGAPSRAGTRPAPTTLDETRPVSTALDETRPGQNEADTRPASTALGDVVGAFKSITTVKYIRRVRDSVWAPFEKRLWQRNYYERIIRNEHALGAIRRYIRDNPARWEADGVNPNPGAWLKEA